MISGAWRQAEIRVVYGIPEYGEMISDGVRMDAYARALRKVVKPGCVVLDIGTGTGVAAMLACQLGARRVYAIEPNDAIFVAQEIAAANGYGATIQFFQALSTEVTLPEPADVIVSDMRGILPLYRNHLVAIADAPDPRALGRVPFAAAPENAPEVTGHGDLATSRIMAATRSSLRGLTRMARSTALASLSASRRGVACLLIG